MDKALAYLALAALALAGCSSGEFSGAARSKTQKDSKKKPDTTAELDQTEEVEDEPEETSDDSEKPPKKKKKKQPKDKSIETAEDILDACKTRDTKEFSQDLPFAAVKNQADPTLSQPEIDDALYEAFEQRAEMTIPNDGIPCTFGFDIAEPLTFDDQFYVGMNGMLLFTSFDLTSKFEKQDDLFVLDWNKIRGTPYQSSTESAAMPWCLWSDSSGSNCRVGKKGNGSASPSNATFSFEPKLSPEISAQLSALALKTKKIVFNQLVVEEGDGPDMVAFTLKVKGTYIEP